MTQALPVRPPEAQAPPPETMKLPPSGGDLLELLVDVEKAIRRCVAGTGGLAEIEKVGRRVSEALDGYRVRR